MFCLFTEIYLESRRGHSETIFNGLQMLLSLHVFTFNAQKRAMTIGQQRKILKIQKPPATLI
jgi:hypothetical protein